MLRGFVGLWDCESVDFWVCGFGFQYIVCGFVGLSYTGRIPKEQPGFHN